MTEGLIRRTVGPGLASEVQESYRAIAAECLQGGCRRVLILGTAKLDATAHIAGRDALRALALAGVPAGFRLALIALTANLIPIYDAAVLEAQSLGIEARRFMVEDDAREWLAG